jgi:hypothetical protein
LKNYERKLYAFIHGRNPSMEEYGLTKLIPECYERTLLSEMSIHLPDVRFWMRLLLWVCVAFLFVSYIIWYDAASGIFRALGEIFDQFYHFLDLKGP